jgi:RNA polymerase sigma-70 factor (ECF subfamily)
MDENKLDSLCNESSYEEAYRIYAPAIFRFIYYKCNDKEQASDIMQEVFLVLWKNCKKVKPEKVKSFLFTVANNQFINVKKRENVRSRFAEQQNQKHEYKTPEFLMEESEFQSRLELAIGNLSEKQRQVFLMSRIEKMKYSEIAEVLEISVKAVEKRMHFALLSLKEILQGK